MRNVLSICNRFIAVILLLTILTGCGSQSYFNEIVTIDVGQFNGANIGVGVEEIKNLISMKPGAEEKGTYLYYNVEFNEQEYFTTEYSFDEKGLYEIHVDIYLNEIADVKRTYEKLKAHFSGKHGQPQSDEAGITVWKLKSERSDDIELSLMDESEEDKAGTLSVSFYDRSF